METAFLWLEEPLLQVITQQKVNGMEEIVMGLNLGAAKPVESVCHKSNGGSGAVGQQTELKHSPVPRIKTDPQ